LAKKLENSVFGSASTLRCLLLRVDVGAEGDKGFGQCSLNVIDTVRSQGCDAMKFVNRRILLQKEPEGGYTVTVPTLPVLASPSGRPSTRQ